MRLPDFSQFEPLLELRRKMGADKLGFFEFFNPNEHLTAEERKELESGVEIPVRKIRVLEDHTLAFKNSRVAIFATVHTQALVGWFHVADCDHVTQMITNNQSVQAITKAPTSSIEASETCRYKVCSDCLQTLRYQGFDSVRNRHRQYSQKVLEEFSIEQFFANYPCYPIKIRKHNPLI